MGRKTKTHSGKVQGIISIISTTMVLILLGLVIQMMLTARVLGDAVKENLTVTVALDDDTPAPDAARLQSQLRTKRYVSSIEYISKERALKEHVESMGIDPTDFLGTNPFSISMEIKMKADYSCNDSLEWITDELKNTPLVSDVMYQKDLVESLNQNIHRASIVLLVIAILLIIVSLSLINNTVRLSVYSHRFSIRTMKLVGARWNFIRRPFLLRSMWIGLASAIMADLLLFGCIKWIIAFDGSLSKFITLHDMGIMAISVVAIGLTITVACTYLSVTHYLRLRESDLY